MLPDNYLSVGRQATAFRLRSEISKPVYLQRHVERPRRHVISDISDIKSSSAHSTVTNSVKSSASSASAPASSRTYLFRHVERPRRHVISDISDIKSSSAHSTVTDSVKSSASSASAPASAIQSQFVTSSPASPTLSPPTAFLQKQPEISSVKGHRKSRVSSKLQLSLKLIAVCMVLTGGYVSLVGWKSDHIAQVQAAKLTSQANQVAQQGSASSALATVKPPPAAVSKYVVAPNLPRYLIIPKLGVHARVLSVGVTATGAMATPNNVYDTSWYNESAGLGQPGATLIDGHVSSWTSHGVFYGIKSLVAGDTIQAQRGDGTMYSYKVVTSKIYSAGQVDMTAAMTPIVTGQSGLNLITCTGDVIPGTSQFNKRIVVFAEQAS
jgi:hypothetical protein